MENNLQYVDAATRIFVEGILQDPSVRTATKDAIRAGLQHDVVDAAADVELAAIALRRVRDSIL